MTCDHCYCEFTETEMYCCMCGLCKLLPTVDEQEDYIDDKGFEKAIVFSSPK